jgi:hypothetical protein
MNKALIQAVYKTAKCDALRQFFGSIVPDFIRANSALPSEFSTILVSRRSSPTQTRITPFAKQLECIFTNESPHND